MPKYKTTISMVYDATSDEDAKNQVMRIAAQTNALPEMLQGKLVVETVRILDA